MKNRVAEAIIVCLLALATGCGMPYVMVVERGKGDYHSTQDFNKPFSEVWDAAVTVMQAYPVRTIEKDSGLLVTDVVRLGESMEYRIAWYPAGKNPPGSQIITTSPMMAGFTLPPYAPQGMMRCNVRVHKIDETSSQVTINIISSVEYLEVQPVKTQPGLFGPTYFRPPPVQRDFETASIGYQESVILWKIARQLGIQQAEPVPPKFETPPVAPTAQPRKAPGNI